MLKRLGVGDSLGELFRRPFLLIEAVRVYFAMRRRGRFTPSSAYLSWRSYTAYGDLDAQFETDDLITFLGWRRRLRTSVRMVSKS